MKKLFFTLINCGMWLSGIATLIYFIMSQINEFEVKYSVLTAWLLLICLVFNFSKQVFQLHGIYSGLKNSGRKVTQLLKNICSTHALGLLVLLGLLAGIIFLSSWRDEMTGAELMVWGLFSILFYAVYLMGIACVLEDARRII